MKKFLSFSMFLVGVMMASSYASAVLHPFQKKDKYGYLDDASEVVIKPSFDIAMTFEEDGLAKVKKGDKWGYINEQGKFVIKCDYTEIEPFKDGIARVNKGGKYGYIKRDGTIYIKPEYNFIGTFNEDGYIWVAKGKKLDEAVKGIYKHDQLIVPVKYTFLAVFNKTDSIDFTNGTPYYNIGNEMTKNFSKLSKNELNYYRATEKFKAVLLDANGKELYKGIGAVGAPRNGYFLVNGASLKKSKYNYVSVDGSKKKLLKNDIEIKHSELQKVAQNVGGFIAYPFNDGYAACYDHKSQKMRIIDTNGANVSKEYDAFIWIGDAGFITKANGQYGIVGTDGKETIAPQYKKILQSVGSKDIVLAALDNNNKCGFIDNTGKVIIPFMYEDATAFGYGLGYVKQNGGWGIVDKDNKPVVTTKWNNITFIKNKDDKFVWVQDAGNKKWYSHSLETDTHTCDLACDTVVAFDSKQRAFVSYGDKWGMVKPDGKNILPMRFFSLTSAQKALAYIEEQGKEVMEEIDAYRFNVYMYENRHKLKLKDTVDKSMWDY